MATVNLYTVKMPSGEELSDLEEGALQKMVQTGALPEDAMVRPTLLKAWRKASQTDFLKQEFKARHDLQTIHNGKRYSVVPCVFRCKAWMRDILFFILIGVALFIGAVILSRKGFFGGGGEAVTAWLVGWWMIAGAIQLLLLTWRGHTFGGGKFHLELLKEDYSHPTLFQAAVYGVLQCLCWWLNLLAVPLTGKKRLLIERLCGLQAYQAFPVN